MTKLSDFQVSGDPGQAILSIHPPARKPKAEIPLKPPTQWHPHVLAFDQSLSSTGWAWLFNGTPKQTGMVTTEPLMDPGFEDSFQRGVILAKGILTVISNLDSMHSVSGRLLIAHEMPIKPNPQMKTRNQEAGIIAAMAVRFAASVSGQRVVMLNAQAVRKALCGNAKVTKTEVREAVRKLVTVSSSLPYLNEHTYDAMGIAIVAAEREGRGE